MKSKESTDIKKAKEKIKEADVIYITAGAGMGVDSGLPDFRGNEGFWREYPIIKKFGYSFVDMANPQWFKSNPKLAWAFYGHRLNLYRKTKPHKGFKLLLELSKSKKDYFVFTSNVDGQFQKAGFSEDKIYECHGSIHYLQCTSCDIPIYSAKDIKVEIDMDKFEAKNIPTCPKCKAVARPNILMFGDWQWDSSRSQKQSIRLQRFLNNTIKNNYKIVVIEIGAGVHIPTVRNESEYIAKELNGFLIRINPRESYIEDSNINGVSLSMGGLEGLEIISKNLISNNDY